MYYTVLAERNICLTKEDFLRSMKRKISKILGVTLTLVMVLSLAIALAPVPVAGACGQNVWAKHAIPKEGKTGNWVLALSTSGKTRGPMDRAINGDLYVHASVDGTTYTLFKSTDDGCTWAYVGTSGHLVKDAIIDIVCAPDDADVLYYATTTDVYKSADGGSRFDKVGDTPGNAGTGNLTIACMDVGVLEPCAACPGGQYIVAVGLVDSGALMGGGVWMLDEGARPFIGWIDSEVGGVPSSSTIAAGGYDVWDVGLSPGYTDDTQIVAVITDGSETYVSTKLGVTGWNSIIGDAELEGGNSPANNVVANDKASIAFADDYEVDTGDGLYGELYVGISDTTVYGDVYSFYGDSGAGNSIAIDLGAGANITDLDVDGAFASANLIAGTKSAGLAKVRRSTDAGDLWKSALKEPTGDAGYVYVRIGDDYDDTDQAWTAVGGVDGGVSLQVADRLWNTIGLINTAILTVTDLSFGSMFMATDNVSDVNMTDGGDDSVWRQASCWQRIWSQTLTDNEAGFDPELVEVSPDHANDNTVFIGDPNDNKKILRSTDGGNKFKAQLKAAPGTWYSWVVIDDQTIIVGASGGTYRTINNGRSWKTLASCSGAGLIISLVLSPFYDTDSTILAGSNDGKIFRSTNAGKSWTEITTSIMSGSVIPAFSNKYDEDETMYCTDSSGGIYRFIKGTTTSWARIDGLSGFPTAGGAAITVGRGLVMSSDGTLYATDNGTTNGGVSRSLDPANSVITTPNPFFEVLNQTIEGTITSEMRYLWLVEEDGINTLWTVYGDKNVYCLQDTLTGSPTGTVPCGESSLRSDSVALSWEALTGGKKYEYDIHTAEAFKGGMGYVVDGGTSTTTNIVELLASVYAGRELYWRVRVYEGKPYRSRWSIKCQFSTKLIGGAWNPSMTASMFPGHFAPVCGSIGVPLDPVFNWNAADWATGYQFRLATNPDYLSPIVEETVNNTVYMLGITLEYSTTYYWRVRGVNANQTSEWAEGVFTTMDVPVEPLPPVVVEPTPAPIIELTTPEVIPTYMLWIIIGIGAILVIALIILIVRTRRVE